jgi:hypothetical protein
MGSTTQPNRRLHMDSSPSNQLCDFDHIVHTMAAGLCTTTHWPWTRPLGPRLAIPSDPHCHLVPYLADSGNDESSVATRGMDSAHPVNPRNRCNHIRTYLHNACTRPTERYSICEPR